VASLSGGEKQRVALARTLAPSPQLLLLDEPLGSLDRVLRDSLLPELAALISDLRLTVLFVTHDRSEAMAISDRVAVMEKGELLQIGTAEQLQHSPISEYVSRLLGHG
jgi:putative spermidine/putrescine transport system ATP-binding protein